MHSLFSPTNKLVAIASRHFNKEEDTSSTSISVAYALSGITEWKQTVPGWARPEAFLFDGKTLAVRVGDKSLRLFATNSGTPLQELKPEAAPSSLGWHEMTIAPNAGLLIAAGMSDKGGVIIVRALKESAKPQP